MSHRDDRHRCFNRFLVLRLPPGRRDLLHSAMWRPGRHRNPGPRRRARRELVQNRAQNHPPELRAPEEDRGRTWVSAPTFSPPSLPRRHCWCLHDSRSNADRIALFNNTSCAGSRNPRFTPRADTWIVVNPSLSTTDPSSTPLPSPKLSSINHPPPPARLRTTQTKKNEK